MSTFPKTSFTNSPNRSKGKHIGIVVNNKDPNKLGAVQVRIPGLIDGKDTVLPWASSIQPPGLGGSSNSKNVAVPNVGSQVIIDMIDEYTLYYSGFLQNNKITNDSLTEDYPNTYGYIDEQGTGWRINRQQQFMEATHSSGSKVKLTKEGDVIIQAARDFTVTAARHITMTAANDFIVNGKKYANTNQNMEISSSSSATITSSGLLSLIGAPLILNG